MPLRPEYQNGIDMDDFFDQLSSLKDANLENLRNSVVDAPSQPVMPKEANPNKMEDAKAEIVANKQITSDRKDSWGKWSENRTMETSIPLLIGGFLAYRFFL